MVGAMLVSLFFGAASAKADWLGESNQSGSMYPPPRLESNAAENFLGDGRSGSVQHDGRAAFDFKTYREPDGPPVFAALPADQ